MKYQFALKIEKSSIGLGLLSFGIFIGLGAISLESLRFAADVGADITNGFMKALQFPFSIVFAVISALLIIFKDLAIHAERIKRINFILLVLLVLFGGLMAKVVHAPRYSDTAALSAVEPAAAPNAARQ